MFDILSFVHELEKHEVKSLNIYPFITIFETDGTPNLLYVENRITDRLLWTCNYN